MPNKLIRTLCLGMLTLGFMQYRALGEAPETSNYDPNQVKLLEGPLDTLRGQVYLILEKQCNVCHREQNPFMVFSLKNMEKRAGKIYKQVFVKNACPKEKTTR